MGEGIAKMELGAKWDHVAAAAVKDHYVTSLTAPRTVIRVVVSFGWGGVAKEK